MTERNSLAILTGAVSTALVGVALLAHITNPHQPAPTYTDAHTLVLELCANTPDDHPTLDLCYDYAHALELNR